MKKTGTSVDIRTIKNFPIDNLNAKIVKDGLFLRVVEREYYWSKEKQRGLERRRYLGYIIDPEFADLFYAYGVLDSGRFIGESSHLVGLGSNQASFYLRA